MGQRRQSGIGISSHRKGALTSFVPGRHLSQCCVESSLVAFPTAEDCNMANETQRQIWGTAGDWSRTEPISDYGTPLLMEALQLRPGERVIDIGCGGAKATVAAARAVGPSGHVTGVDIAQGMIDIAKRRRDEAKLDNIELAVCDAQVDAFPSGPFDAALSQFGIMFFDQPISALQNIKRQMNPGGRVAFTVWSGQHISLNPGPIVAKYGMNCWPGPGPCSCWSASCRRGEAT